MTSPDTSERLPADRAFVLQFEASCANGRDLRDEARGRVEHVVSGRALRFRSFDELGLFLATVLREAAVKRGEAQ
jgi:hypothetical protein